MNNVVEPLILSFMQHVRNEREAQENDEEKRKRKTVREGSEDEADCDYIRNRDMSDPEIEKRTHTRT